MTNEERRLGYAACDPEPSHEDEDEQRAQDEMIARMKAITAHIERHFNHIYRVDYDKVSEAIDNLESELGGVL